MQKNRNRNVFALMFIAGLIIVSSAGVLAGVPAVASRVSDVIAHIISAPTTSVTPIRAAGEQVTVQRDEARASSLNLSSDTSAVPTEYATGTGVADFALGTRAHALASADFDGDGVPDLIGGYAGAGGAGIVTFQRGNVDAIYPNSTEARERRGRGAFSDAPFHREASAFSVPEAAHFIGAGDFDANGHWDIVAARRGGRALYFLRGDGRGNFAAAERIELAGAVTTLATGEINRRDGLTDIVVGISGEAGARVIVSESPMGALRAQPETFVLPTAASGLALGAVDADLSANDLAIAAGRELIVVHGRDRRLSLDESSRGDVPEARVSRGGFDFNLKAVAIGDFAGDERADVAVLSDGGAVHVLTRAGSTKGKETKRSRGRRDAAPTVPSEQVNADAAGNIDWQHSERASVRVTEGAAIEAETASVLLTAKVSSLEKDDLLVLGGGQAHLITNEVLPLHGKVAAVSSEPQSVEAADELRVAASLSSESETAAVLPMRLNSSALSSLVVLGAGSKAAGVVRPQAAVTFTVNSAADTRDVSRTDGECRDANGNCTLPAAADEIFHTTNPGPFAVNFNVPGADVPVITTTDLFINKPVVIDGTTQSAGRVEVRGQARSLFIIRGGGSTVRGLVISGADNAIVIQTLGDNIIEGNHFGTNADGSVVAATPNTTSILIDTSNNRIGGTTPAARNIISGSTDNGILIRAGSGNVIQGNRIGTNADGNLAMPNLGHGIIVDRLNITVGGAVSGAGNLISGNGDDGINISGFFGSPNHTIQGNLIGTDVSGTLALPNQGDGIETFRADNTLIGGTTPEARNVISGNLENGILLRGVDNINNGRMKVQGNYIGVNRFGTGALGNRRDDGIFYNGDGSDVGGTAPGAGNVIAHNGGGGIVSNRDLLGEQSHRPHQRASR